MDANPRASITWRFKQKRLTNSGSTLHFPSVAQSELGEYTCEARSPLPDFPPTSARRFLLSTGFHFILLYFCTFVLYSYIPYVFWLLNVRMPHLWNVESPKILEIAILFGRSRIVTSAVSVTDKIRCLNVSITFDARKSERTRGTLSLDLLVRAVPHPTSVLLFTTVDGTPRPDR